ncbi:hypothetical protein MKK88_08835 [Methylobacterium sp. E-005]|nr:hypothetical protein [Methylobacterium sp. E-005]
MPELGKYSGSAKEKRFAAAVIYVGFGILALIPALLSFVDFRDSSIIENGVSARAKISTVQNGKSTASGWIDYSLPNGIGCHDWTELAPKGSVRPGDDIIVAVDRVCGHPVSRIKPLHPWYYLSISFGIIIAMLYQLRKLKKGEIRTGNIA